MTGQVFNLHSTVEVPADDLDEIITNIDIPDGIESLEKTVRENVVVIESEPESDEISTYTPTANIKATLEEKTERPEEEPGFWQQSEEDDETEVEKVTYAGFKGYGESVLYNKALQYEMFKVLCQIATTEEASGTVTALVVKDDELEPIKIVDGEQRPAEVEIVDTSKPGNGSDSADWESNKFL